MPGAGQYDRLLRWQRHAYGPDPADGFGSAADQLQDLGRVWAAVEAEAASPESRQGGDAQVVRAVARVRGCRPLAPLDVLTEVLEGVATAWEVEAARVDPAARETVCDLVSPPTRPGP
jgi:hypothetical protein